MGGDKATTVISYQMNYEKVHGLKKQQMRLRKKHVHPHVTAPQRAESCHSAIIKRLCSVLLEITFDFKAPNLHWSNGNL